MIPSGSDLDQTDFRIVDVTVQFDGWVFIAGLACCQVLGAYLGLIIVGWV